MKRLVIVLLFCLVGCTSSPNDQARADLVKVKNAWQQFEAKNGFGPEPDRFDKYLKEYGNPQEIHERIGIRWQIDTRTWPKGDLIIAWQKTSQDGKYYALLVNGQIEQFDKDEMSAHGVYLKQKR